MGFLRQRAICAKNPLVVKGFAQSKCVGSIRNTITDRYGTLGYSETKADAIKRYKNQNRHQEKSPRNRKNSFKVYNWVNGNYYFIGCKVGKEYVEIQSSFENVDAAYSYLSSHEEELEEKLEKYRDIP